MLIDVRGIFDPMDATADDRQVTLLRQDLDFLGALQAAVTQVILEVHTPGVVKRDDIAVRDTTVSNPRSGVSLKTAHDQRFDGVSRWNYTARVVSPS